MRWWCGRISISLAHSGSRLLSPWPSVVVAGWGSRYLITEWETEKGRSPDQLERRIGSFLPFPSDFDCSVCYCRYFSLAVECYQYPASAFIPIVQPSMIFFLSSSSFSLLEENRRSNLEFYYGAWNDVAIRTTVRPWISHDSELVAGSFLLIKILYFYNM